MRSQNREGNIKIEIKKEWIRAGVKIVIDTPPSYDQLRFIITNPSFGEHEIEYDVSFPELDMTDNKKYMKLINQSLCEEVENFISEPIFNKGE